jgi:hypothetical protein
MSWFAGGDCDAVVYSTDLFTGVGFWCSVWLTSFLSPILVMCLVGRGLELGHPLVSTGLVLRSLSANHMPGMGEVLPVGELYDYWVVSYDMWTTLVRERCFRVGCLWRAQIVLVTRFVWIFSSWLIDNITFPCNEMFLCWSEGVGIQLYLVAHFFNTDGIVSEVVCSEHAHMQGGLRKLFLCSLSSILTCTVTPSRKTGVTYWKLCTAPCTTWGWNDCYTVHNESFSFLWSKVKPSFHRLNKFQKLSFSW